jgi:hypothetical protein
MLCLQEVSQRIALVLSYAIQQFQVTELQVDPCLGLMHEDLRLDASDLEVNHIFARALRQEHPNLYFFDLGLHQEVEEVVILLHLLHLAFLKHHHFRLVLLLTSHFGSDLGQPVVDRLWFFEAKGDFVEVIFDLEVVGLLLVVGIMYLLKMCTLDIVVSRVVFVLGAEVDIYVAFTHYRHILLPDLCVAVFYVNHPDFGCLSFYIFLLCDPLSHPCFT